MCRQLRMYIYEMISESVWRFGSAMLISLASLHVLCTIAACPRDLYNKLCNRTSSSKLKKAPSFIFLWAADRIPPWDMLASYVPVRYLDWFKRAEVKDNGYDELIPTETARR